MNIAAPSIENAGPFTRACGWHKLLPNKIVEMAQKIKKLGQDDPRRILHSLKVGLALTLVSLFYYIQPLYGRIGENSIWAIITVILVLEFSVGATLAKGLNRMLVTLSAGALGVGVHHLATLSGEKLRRAHCTWILRRYDSSKFSNSLEVLCIYAAATVPHMAHQRVTTIIMGSFIAIVTCICIRPVWIGDELQNLVANNIEKLGNFLQAFSLRKNNEETMANLARWELWHYRFGLFHPWKQYVKVGTLTQQCTYKIEALNNYLNSEIQVNQQYSNF
ncbi:hypothetical protein ACB098_08G089100 [Castanea mollissima]